MGWNYNSFQVKKHWPAVISSDYAYRERNLIQIAMVTEGIDSLEQYEIRSALPRNKSSPNLQNSGIDAPKVPPIVKARASQSCILQKGQTSNKYRLHSDRELQLGITSLSISSVTDALFKHVGRSIHFLLPQRLAYAALTPAETSCLKQDCLELNVILLSFRLHRKYIPLCADFGPVTINIVHRFCQVCLKYLFLASLFPH